MDNFDYKKYLKENRLNESPYDDDDSEEAFQEGFNLGYNVIDSLMDVLSEYSEDPQIVEGFIQGLRENGAEDLLSIRLGGK